MSARLLDDALPRVDEDHRDIRGRGAGDHVARVLDMPGRVGELKPAARGHERAVGDVDRDPLLALCAQAVREQREVDVVVPAAPRRVLDVLELVDEDLLRVVEQPADQRRLAVVHRACGHEPRELGVHQLPRSSQRASGPPSRPPRHGRPRGSRRAPSPSSPRSRRRRPRASRPPTARRPCTSCRRPCGSGPRR